MKSSSRFLIPTQAGIALRVGIGAVLLAFNPDGMDAGGLAFLIGMTAFSYVPYVVTYLLTQSNPTRGAAVALTALAADSFAVLTGMVWPQGSTAGLIVVFMPLWNLLLFIPWNLLLFIPIAYMGTTIVQKARAHRREAA